MKNPKRITAAFDESTADLSEKAKKVGFLGVRRKLISTFLFRTF